MNLHQCILTENDCYKAGRRIVPKGVMVHSTGANNPRLSRYVGPDDGLLGQNPYGNHWNQGGIAACVHAFIGRLADGSIATYQTLPWDMRGWHCASGPSGSGKDTHISFEICEDGLTDAGYFSAVYREAVELTAMLCGVYGLDPLADGVVICHQEGYQRGIASNHADVLHWFPRFGRSMDDFRADVAREMEDKMTQEQFNAMLKSALTEERAAVNQQPAADWAQAVWEKATAAGVFDGSRPNAPLTRQEAALVLDRLGLIKEV